MRLVLGLLLRVAATADWHYPWRRSPWRTRQPIAGRTESSRSPPPRDARETADDCRHRIRCPYVGVTSGNPCGDPGGQRLSGDLYRAPGRGRTDHGCRDEPGRTDRQHRLPGDRRRPVAGRPDSLAKDAIFDLPPVAAPQSDIEVGIIMTRLDVRVAPTATVGEVNAALTRVGARSCRCREGFWR